MIYKYTFLRSFTFLSFYLISPSLILNFQFSILKKPACFYHFAPAFQQKTPAFSLFMPTFLKQINGNRFQSSLDLLSISVYLDCILLLYTYYYHRRFFFIPFTHLFILLIFNHFLWRVWKKAFLLQITTQFSPIHFQQIHQFFECGGWNGFLFAGWWE